MDNQRDQLGTLEQIVALLPYLRWPEINWLQSRIAAVEARKAYREWRDEKKALPLIESVDV